MSESIQAQLPTSGVPPHELPASLRAAGLTNWIREPLMTLSTEGAASSFHQPQH